MHRPLPDPPAYGVANRRPDTFSWTGAGFLDQAAAAVVPVRRRRVWQWVLVALIFVAGLAVTLWSTLVVGAGRDGRSRGLARLRSDDRHLCVRARHDGLGDPRVYARERDPGGPG